MSATPFAPIVRSFPHDADFSSSQWLIVKANGDTDLDICGAGEQPYGVLTSNVEDGSTTASKSDVQIGGQIKVEAGATVARGAAVMANAAGEAITGTDGNWCLGYALSGGADGELISVNFGPFYLETT
jgi:hypothetical protein